MKTMSNGQMSRMGLLAAALALGAASAHAADLPPRTYSKSAPAPAAYDWSGFYIGAQIGGAYARDEASTPGGELLSPISIHEGSFFGGGYVGYNIQVSSFVLGVEGDLAGTLGGRGFSVEQPTLVPGVFAAGSSDPKYLGTVAGRLGFAADNWLLYGKAGGAWMKSDYTVNVVTGGGATLGTQTISANRSGWLAGVGLEYAWNPNWVSRAEYNYLDFGSKDLDYTFVGLNRGEFKSSMHLFKVGLAYKFGGNQVARY